MISGANFLPTRAGLLLCLDKHIWLTKSNKLWRIVNTCACTYEKRRGDNDDLLLYFLTKRRPVSFSCIDACFFGSYYSKTAHTFCCGVGTRFSCIPVSERPNFKTEKRVYPEWLYCDIGGFFSYNTHSSTELFVFSLYYLVARLIEPNTFPCMLWTHYADPTIFPLASLTFRFVFLFPSLRPALIVYFLATKPTFTGFLHCSQEERISKITSCLLIVTDFTLLLLTLDCL